MKKFSKILFLITALTMISSCTVAPLTGRKQLKLISDESVISSSSSAYAKLISDARAKNLLANNTPDGERLRRIGGRVKSAVEQYLTSNGMSKKLSNLNWEFNLIRSDQINAFAMPGGKIAFYTGIMPVLGNDAGIAFVMGHEIGHVMAMAGYDPAEAIRAEERMESLLSSNKRVEILSTHPSGKNRIEAMKKFLPEAMKYYSAR